MTKDFDAWNAIKKQVDAVPERVFFHERELWFARVGINVGFEQDGRGHEAMRPVLIVRKFNNEVCWVLPLTRVQKPDNSYYAPFLYAPSSDGTEPLQQSTAIVSQLRLVDGKRLRYKIGTTPEEYFEHIKKRLRQLLA